MLDDVTKLLSGVMSRLALQGWRGAGDIRTTVPAYAGLRRFYSCTICNNRVPPSMPLTRHLLVVISEKLCMCIYVVMTKMGQVKN